MDLIHADEGTRVGITLLGKFGPKPEDRAGASESRVAVPRAKKRSPKR
jgi:hypothetical protein